MNDYEEELTTTEKLLGALQQGLEFSIVEAIFVVLFILERTIGDRVISPYILWGSLVFSVGWVAITLGKQSYEDAKMYVLSRHLFMSDFIVSSALLTVGAILVWPYAWYFPAVLLIAAAQNLRYTYLSMNWLLEEKSGNYRGDDHLS